MKFVARFSPHDHGPLNFVFIVGNCASGDPRRRIMAYMPAPSKHAAGLFVTSKDDAHRVDLVKRLVAEARSSLQQAFWCASPAVKLSVELEQLHLSNYHQLRVGFLAEVEADSAAWDAQPGEAARQQGWPARQQGQEQENRQREEDKLRQEQNRQRKREEAQRWHQQKAEREQHEAEQRRLGRRSTQKRLMQQQQGGAEGDAQADPARPSRSLAGSLAWVLSRRMLLSLVVCAVAIALTALLPVAGAAAYSLLPLGAIVLLFAQLVLEYAAKGCKQLLSVVQKALHAALAAAGSCWPAEGLVRLTQAAAALMSWALRKRQPTCQPPQHQQQPGSAAASRAEPEREQHAARDGSQAPGQQGRQQASQASPLRSRGWQQQRKQQERPQRQAPAAQANAQQQQQQQQQVMAEPLQQQGPGGRRGGRHLRQLSQERQPPQQHMLARHQPQPAASSQQGRAGQPAASLQRFTAARQHAAAAAQPAPLALPQGAAPEPVMVFDASQHPASTGPSEGRQLQEPVHNGTGTSSNSPPARSSSNAPLVAGSDAPAARYAATELTFFPTTPPLQAGAAGGGRPESSATGALRAAAAAAACVCRYEFDDSECVMCMEELRSVVLYPCTHQVLCRTCTQKLMQRGSFTCPLCREEVLNVL